MSAPTPTAGHGLIDNRSFWLMLAVGGVILHLVAIWLYATQGFENVWVRLWGIIVVLHILEIPLAFLMLKDRKVPWGLTVWNTLVLGFAWWVPTRRGVYHPDSNK